MPDSQMARSSCMGTRVASCRTASHWSYWKTSARPGPCRWVKGLRGHLGLNSGALNFSPKQTCKVQEEVVEVVPKGSAAPDHRSPSETLLRLGNVVFSQLIDVRWKEDVKTSSRCVP